jgi:PAS domain S-box-containing protein
MTTTDASAVLIVAPLGKDAELAADVFHQHGIASRICAGIAEAAQEFNESSSAFLLAEEALDKSELPLLLDALKKQPPWSDIPVIILTSSGGGERMSLQAVDIFGPAGNVTLLERPLHGITLISAMKVALRARQRQFEVRELIEQRETVLTSISDAFSSIGHDWRYLYVNDRVAELAGLRKAEMLGRNIWELFPDAVGGDFYQLAHQAMEGRRAVQGEIFHQPSSRWLDTRIYPTKEGIVVFRADVTERKQQEALAREHEIRLQENEALLRLAIEAADAGTFDYYPLTGELRLSDRCKELFGLSGEKRVTYEHYLNSIHPDDRHIVRETVDGILRADSTGRYDIEYRASRSFDGAERWLAEKGRAILDESGRATRFIGTILDVTERKNAEIVLQTAKQAAEDANRTKDQFLAMLSHELRTPLTPVLMTIASLRRQPDLADDLQHDLEVLQRNVELEALLIDDLLDLTRIAHGKLELHNDAVDIHKSLDHALNISNSDLQAKQLTIIRHYNAAEHHSWADAARLQQVFWNLVKNAVKFTPTGGRLEIRTHNDGAHNIIVDVTDTGIGIDAALLPRIFDAFEQGGRTTTSQYGGLGLGLAISKRVVDMHGGSLSARSGGRGEGSTFTLRLAAMQTSLLDLPVTYLQDEPAAVQPASILLVEDHADTARVLRRILEHAGFEVAHAGTVADAQELAGRLPFDLVISDVGLPDGTGVDLMRFLRTHHRLSGIALSGFGTDEDVAASSAAGFAEHLTKPVDWPQLRDAINRVLAGKPRMRTEAAVS